MKEKILEVDANISLRPKISDMELGQGFVRLCFQSNEGVNRGEKLYIFDHRPEVVESVAKAVGENGTWEDINKAIKAIEKSATVIVMKKRVYIGETKMEFPYINLFPIKDGKIPTTLLSRVVLIGKHNANFWVLENHALWSWRSRSFSRTGRHWGMEMVCLTDEAHRIIVKENIRGHVSLTVLGLERRDRVSEEEFIVGWEP